MKLFVLGLAFASAALGSPSAQGGGEKSTLEESFQIFRERNIELLSATRPLIIEGLLEQYEQLGMHNYAARIPMLTNEDLKWLFRAITSILLYGPELELAEDLKAVFGELRSRGALEDRQVSVMYRHYIEAGKLDQARRFALEFNESLDKPLPDIPTVIDGEYAPGPGIDVLKVMGPGLPLIRKNLPLFDDATILIQFAPLCGVANRMIWLT